MPELGEVMKTDLDIAFDAQNCAHCKFDDSFTVAAHVPGAKAYCLANKAVRNGIVQWKIEILKESPGN